VTGDESGRITRRRLLKTGAVAALVAGAGGAGRALAGVGGSDLGDGPGIGMPRGGAAYLHRGTYAPLVGSEFKVLRPGGRTLRMKLVAAQARPGVGDSFSLLFRGRRTTGVESGIYRLEHPLMGSFELFLNPVERGVKGLNLEAVINRIAT
jgi:hypothetical protein